MLGRIAFYGFYDYYSMGDVARLLRMCVNRILARRRHRRFNLITQCSRPHGVKLRCVRITARSRLKRIHKNWPACDDDDDYIHKRNQLTL